MEKCRLIEVERFLEASLNYVKGTNSCAVEDDFTFERVEQCESDVAVRRSFSQRQKPLACPDRRATI